jgi:hypothetical protein
MRKMNAARGLAMGVALLLMVPQLRAFQETGSPEPGRPLDYEIWVELDDAGKTLHGREQISWRNLTQDEVSDMWFHLYWNAFKNEKSAMLEESRSEGSVGRRAEEEGWGWIDIRRIALADGTDLGPTLEFMIPDQPAYPGDQTVARVLFPAPIKPGEEVRLEIDWESKIPRTIARSGYCHEYHLNSEFYADFADFVVHITVPASFVVGASGKQKSAVSAQDGKTVTYTYEQTRIHDFAWTADPDFIKVERDFIAAQEVSEAEYAELSEKVGLPVEELKLPDVKMILLIEPEHRKQTERHFKALRMALKYYGLWFGPYPYETVTMVDPPFQTGSGGMEYPTLFTAGTGILTDEKVLSPEGVIIHEFGHGYWYGLAANNEFEEAWLDEGINTYSTGRVSSKAYGPGMLSSSLFGYPLSKIFNFPRYNDHDLDRLGAILIAERDPITTYSWEFIDRMSYGMNVYQRAAACLTTLERYLGEATMLRLMRTFQMRFRFRHPHTQDFIDVANEVSGQDLGWFFKEFFFKTHDFDYGVSSLRTAEKKENYLGVFDVDGKKKEVKKKDIEQIKKPDAEKETDQKTYVTDITVRRFGEARIGGEARIRLRVVFEDGHEETAHWDGQSRWTKFRFESPSRAKSAEVDPELVWLIDSNISNNSLKVRPGKAGVIRLTSRLLFWVQNYLHYLSALS